MNRKFCSTYLLYPSYPQLGKAMPSFFHFRTLMRPTSRISSVTLLSLSTRDHCFPSYRMSKVISRLPATSLFLSVTSQSTTSTHTNVYIRLIIRQTVKLYIHAFIIWNETFPRCWSFWTSQTPACPCILSIHKRLRCPPAS